jgi:uncharacterized membrane protein YidH (DUF202 family)
VDAPILSLAAVAHFHYIRSVMLKKALIPILLIVGIIVVLTAVARWYEQKWGLEGPFPSEHHH